LGDTIPPRSGSSARTILLASLIGTTIEFFDFYIYATAAVLVFPKLFFPQSDQLTGTLQSFATFALAFFARPIGSALFGHFGDRIGRKATLITALLTMGISTIVIGLLPTYASIGVSAAVLLAACRLGQGLGLGGEWGGAVLLATENAPPGKEAWYGSFPQLGAPLGFLCSTGVFLLLSSSLSEAQFLAWGWRVPFLASAVLVLFGLAIRLRLVETPQFKRLLERGERERVPLLSVISRHSRALVLGTLAATATFLVFYLMTVFTLYWATTKLGFSRRDFLILLMLGVLFFGATIPISALVADRIGARLMLIIASLGLFALGFAFQPLFGAGSGGAVLGFLALGLALTGLTYGPLGSCLAGLFPTSVRYTGASLTFNFAGIVGAAWAPRIAATLANEYGLPAVGWYLSAAAAISLSSLVVLGRLSATRDPVAT